MMRWIVGSSLRLAALVGVIAAVLLFLGLTQLRNAPLDVYPEYAAPQVQIQTEALGLSSAEVEALITVPMEAELNGVPWVDHIDSDSVPGMSSITLVFERGTDLYRARQLVTERLAQGPGVAKVGSPPVMIQPLSSTSRVMMLSLSSTQLSPIEMSVLARWKIRPKLMGVPGVANVAVWGQRDRQLQIQVDPVKLHSYGISLSKVIDTAGNTLWSSPLTFVEASTPGSDGFIDTPAQRLGIQHVLPITSAKQLSDVTFEDTGGRTLRMGDVATVTEDHQPLIGDAVLSGGKPGLLLVVQKAPGANTLEVTRAVEDAMNEMKPGLAGITVDTHVYRPASFIDSALRNVGLAALAGLLLMVVLLSGLLYSLRVAAIAVLSIVLSLVTAAYVLYLAGAVFNMMVLAGLVIAVGAVVDDSVGDLVLVRRRLRAYREGGSRGPLVEVVKDAVSGIRGPVGYALVVILLTCVPLYLLGGVPGAFARPLVESYGLALIVSMLVALLVTPAFAYLLLPAGGSLERRQGPPARLGGRLFGRLYPAVLAKRGFAYAAIAVLVAAGLSAIPLVGSGKALIPAPKDRDLLVHWQAAPGTSLHEMDRITGLAVDRLRAVPGVRDAGAQVGRAVTGDTTGDVDSGEIWVALAGSADYGRTVAAVRRTVTGYPGIAASVTTYEADQLAAAQARPARPVTVRLYGTDFTTLNQQAALIRQMMAATPGVRGARIESQPLVPTVQVQVNLAEAQRYGLKPGDVRRAAATLVNGLLVGNLYQDQQIFDVVVVGKQSLYSNVADLRNLVLDTPSGGQVRLGDVASVQISAAPPSIMHHEVSRSVDITANVHGRDADAVVDTLQDKVNAMSLPIAYHADVIDNRADTDDANTSLLAYSLAIALAIFLVLQAAFRSWRRAGLVFPLLVLSVSGGVAMSAVDGGLDTAGALIGLLMVLGLAVRGCVLFVRAAQELEETPGAAATPLELVTLAVRERTPATVVTALTTAGALAPFAVLSDAAGTELLHPLAIVVLGGLVSTSLVTLLVLPALYLRFVRPRLTGAPPAVPDKTEPEPAASPDGPGEQDEQDEQDEQGEQGDQGDQPEPAPVEA